jgi:transketolase
MIDQRIDRLKEQAKEVRFHVIDMVHAAQSGHPGGSLSAADLMTALYFDVLRVDPANPRDPERDRFVMSKGHACPVYYACLALRGFFPVEELRTLRRFESRLQGHPVQGKLPGIDVSTGSLGVGFAEALGMALEARMLRRGHKVYAVMGDGEQQEGIVWETAAAASRFGLDNLVAIVDVNSLQNDGFVDDIMPVEPLDAKYRDFGWQVERIDGNRMEEVLPALERARDHHGTPYCIVARTTKGRGVSFMENLQRWHGKPPNDEEYARAVAEIRRGLQPAAPGGRA